MRLIVLFTFVLTTFFGFTQDKNFTINEAIAGYHLYPRGLSQLQWIPDGKFYSQSVKNDSGQMELVIKNAVDQREVDRVTLSDIKNSTADGNYVSSMPAAAWINAEEFRFHANEMFYAFNYKSKKLDLYINQKLREA